ncbi:MAG: BadF/BadG/BcrA/BcrD ATPase family protein [Pseudomonadota bacterium]|nr:BadF/BadG/BcrA/BcrD ATPase family protein [Pseudomonadota bacterium]
MSKLLFGVNGGGSGCRVVLATSEGKIISKSEGGAANIETSFTEAKINIVDACKAALKLASLPENEIYNSKALLGLAGSNMGDFDKNLSEVLPFAENTIINDGEITLEGAIGSRDGCIAALGTGSVFLGRKNGVLIPVGGWGFLLGDDGSGAKIGLELFRTTIKCHDRIEPHSELTLQVIREHQNHIVNIVNGTRGFKPKDFATFAPTVFEFYHKGDLNAIKIINTQIAIIERSIIASGFDPQLPFCLLGGLGPSYKPLLSKTIKDFISEPLGNPLDGALSLALKKYGN